LSTGVWLRHIFYFNRARTEAPLISRDATLAEDIGIEPISPFQNEGLANPCRTLQHIFLSSWSITILEPHATTFVFDSLNHVFKQDGSEVCLFNADTVVACVNLNWFFVKSTNHHTITM